MRFSEWNSIETTESIEFVEDYFLLNFVFYRIFNSTKIVFYKIL